MDPAELLRQTNHRPWPLPKGPWVMRQGWDDLLFAHWPLPPAEVAAKVPPGLQLDTYDGAAWVGIVPFVMTGVRPRGVPAVPRFSNLYEINVRTYVTVEGKAGVYFFSLDASSPLAVALARRLFYLPYFNASFSVQRNGGQTLYRSVRMDRRSSAGEFEGAYRPTGPVLPVAPGSLEAFLTERYCLYCTGPRGTVYRGEIHHQQWPLQPAELAEHVDTLPHPAGLRLPNSHPHLLFSRHLDVLVWPIARVPAS